MLAAAHKPPLSGLMCGCIIRPHPVWLGQCSLPINLSAQDPTASLETATAINKSAHLKIHNSIYVLYFSTASIQTVHALWISSVVCQISPLWHVFTAVKARDHMLRVQNNFTSFATTKCYFIHSLMKLAVLVQINFPF